MELFDPRGRAAEDPRDLAERLVSRFRSKGLGPGDVLATALPNGPEFAAAFIACARLEVTFAPVHPSLAPAELEERIEVTGASAVLSSDGELIRRRRDTEARVPGPALILFTSGSSGTPRAIGLDGAGLLSVVDSHHAALGYPGGTRILGCLPWTHAFGFTLELLMALLKGARLRSVPPASLIETLTEARPELLFAVPRTVSAVPDPVLDGLEGGIVGGAPVRGALRQRLQRTKLRVGYGQTECSPGVTLGEPGEWEHDDFLGRPVGCQVKLGPLDDSGGRELLVRGQNTALGEVDRGGMRRLVDEGGWLATGDLAVATPDGGLVFQGRSDERFKLDNGRMVNPVPLELSFGDRLLLIGAGQEMVQPLVRGDIPPDFHLSVPHRPPRTMPESFWIACTTPSGKVSRRRAEELFRSS